MQGRIHNWKTNTKNITKKLPQNSILGNFNLKLEPNNILNVQN